MSAASTGQPYYRLAAFQELIRSLPPDQLIIAYTSATARIVTLLGSTEHEAREYVLGVVLVLNTGDYVETVVLNGGYPADVYGIVMEEAPLYVKLSARPKGKLTAKNHLILSCHPTEFPLRTRAGVISMHEG